jgi:hypothetical protein
MAVRIPVDAQPVEVFVPSRTRGGPGHHVKVMPGGIITCDCKGFTYGQNCHAVQTVRRLRQQLAGEDTGRP